MGKVLIAKPKKTGFSPKDIHHGVNFHTLSSDLYTECCALCEQAHTQINK